MENLNMNGKIKITESLLNQIISESIEKILSELDWRTYQKAANKANDLSDKAPDDYEHKRRENQRKKFQNKAHETYSTQYNLKNFDDNESELPLI